MHRTARRVLPGFHHYIQYFMVYLIIYALRRARCVFSSGSEPSFVDQEDDTFGFVDFCTLIVTRLTTSWIVFISPPCSLTSDSPTPSAGYHRPVLFVLLTCSTSSRQPLTIQARRISVLCQIVLCVLRVFQRF